MQHIYDDTSGINNIEFKSQNFPENIGIMLSIPTLVMVSHSNMHHSTYTVKNYAMVWYAMVSFAKT